MKMFQTAGTLQQIASCFQTVVGQLDERKLAERKSIFRVLLRDRLQTRTCLFDFAAIDFDGRYMRLPYS